MGDCDDCTVLYCALLANMGISTALVDAPGHVYMMFDSGVTDRREFGFSLPTKLFVEREGRYWIPIEVTKLGEGSFLDAWELGALTSQELKSSGKLELTDVQSAWADYGYAQPVIPGDVTLPNRDVLEGGLLTGLQGLQDWRESFVNRAYIRPLLANPQDHHLRMSLAKTRMESEDYNGAISTLVPLLDTSLKGEALFLIGYGYAKQKAYPEAVQYLQQAAQLTDAVGWEDDMTCVVVRVTVR